VSLIFQIKLGFKVWSETSLNSQVLVTRCIKGQLTELKVRGIRKAFELAYVD